MIAHLRGTVADVRTSTAIIDVAGVGYLVHIAPRHALSLRHGDEATVRTHLVVREDAQLLYGFESEEALDTFLLLTAVSGVGPKSALAVLGTLTPREIAAAVEAEDDAPFRRVSGIGPKTAKLITVQLQGRMLVAATDAEDAPAVLTGNAARVRDDLVDALVSLGYSAKQAGVAAETVIERAPLPGDLQALLRAALAELRH